MINYFIIASNPFLDSYIHSDLLGKLIFIALIVLSIGSWIILLHKLWIVYQTKKNSFHFQQAFHLQKKNPLNMEVDLTLKNEVLNPFRLIYALAKKNTLELLNKNQQFTSSNEANSKTSPAYLSPSDIEYVENHLFATISQQTKNLEKNLFILSTVVSLGPFLGLLGTVWGILTTFSNLQTHASANTHQIVLGGLSLALATTVLGLIDAIPALIGYNYLKNTIREFETEMELFAHEILSSIEMQYRKVDIH